MSYNIFIIGVGRSGTSLLQSMLGAHPAIGFLPETQFLRKYCFSTRSKKLIEKKGSGFFRQKLRDDASFARLQIRPEDCVLDQTPVSIIGVYGQILKKYLLGRNKTIPGDKDPRNLDFIKEIHQYFPDARILHIIRDPRDVVLSRTKAEWSKRWPFFLHACMYDVQLTRGRKWANRLFKDHYREIFYEDLLEQPEEVLKEICNWLNCAYDPAMLRYQDTAKSLVASSEMQWKKETLGPLLKKNKNKWRTELTAYQVSLVERICTPALRQLPYKKADVEGVSGMQRLKIAFFLIFSRIFKLLYPLRLKWL